MKKQLLTKQDYLDAHLKEFKAIYQNKEVKGIIFVQNNNIFLLNNEHGLDEPTNKDWKNCGYKYSHQRLVFEGFQTHFYSLTIEDQWLPQFGELVEVSDNENKWKERIFLGTRNDRYHCVHELDSRIFNSSSEYSYRVIVWNYIRQIETPKQPVKRLPTIEEVLNWFEENKIFKSKIGRSVRILSVMPNEKSPIELHRLYTIEEFCNNFTDQNDNELYITE